MHNPVRAKAPSDLEATGVALVGAAAAFTGALVDIAVAQKLGLAFLATFLVVSVWGAARVRRCELPAAVVLPPLVFAVVAFLAGQFLGGHDEGSWLVGQGLDLVSALATGAPALLAGTVLAGAVAGGRLLMERRAARMPDGVEAEHDDDVEGYVEELGEDDIAPDADAADGQLGQDAADRAPAGSAASAGRDDEDGPAAGAEPFAPPARGTSDGRTSAAPGGSAVAAGPADGVASPVPGAEGAADPEVPSPRVAKSA
ncbi:DUF6542 domain-containing protein [Motilibacter aurantiacus]|uniref:DUF6542 domain-containing protein n=1 Tax=Motilibacter aurantiacus TaxID=2714955 RepID=UPI00140E6868|nr:DUF6542 domain-containing protein [Motilibacter aurantiacus]NHC45774.1 hypothetical protein [Motilibacter aurantiacus]